MRAWYYSCAATELILTAVICKPNEAEQRQTASTSTSSSSCASSSYSFKSKDTFHFLGVGGKIFTRHHVLLSSVSLSPYLPVVDRRRCRLCFNDNNFAPTKRKRTAPTNNRPAASRSISQSISKCMFALRIPVHFNCKLRRSQYNKWRAENLAPTKKSVFASVLAAPAAG